MAPSCAGSSLGPGRSWCGWRCTARSFTPRHQDLEHRTIRMEAVVTQWPEETDYGVRVPVRAGEREGRKVSALFYGPADLADLRPGDRISCVARCTPAEELGGEESLYYPSQGILLRMKGYGQVMVSPGGE